LQHFSIPPKPNTACTDVDYKAIVYGVQLAIHFMRKNSPPGGKIVATASIAAVHPHSSYPEYCGAKAAVRADLSLRSNESTDTNQVLNFARCVAPVLKVVSDMP